MPILESIFANSLSVRLFEIDRNIEKLMKHLILYKI